MIEPDHRLMTPPSLRVSLERKSAEGGNVYLWDLRVGQPNVAHLPMPVVHSLEHFLATHLRADSDRVVTVAPMGCQTGFYIVTVDLGGFDEMASLLESSLAAVVRATEVPVANCVQCGWAENHSLEGAREVAGWLLRRRPSWSQVTLEGDAEGR